MKLIVGLGNPGKKYARNRHNVGAMCADYLCEEMQKSTVNSQNYTSRFKNERHLLSDIAMIELVHEKILIAKPQTFMNRSGDAVIRLITNYQLPITDILVVHDDLDIPLGKSKIQLATGPKVHNGLLSIEEKLGTDQFWRIRIGVENRDPANRLSGEAYVLQDFTPEEYTRVKDCFASVYLSSLNL